MEIPVIDLTGVVAGARDALAQAGAAVREACEQVGFFYVAGHGVQRSARDAAFEASRRFHTLDLTSKLRLSINEFHRGYIPMKSYAITSEVRPNLSESIIFLRELSAADPEWGQPLQGPNQWPELPGWKEVVLGYQTLVERLGHRLLRIFEAALELPDRTFAEAFARPTTFLRLLHYPPQDRQSPENQFGSAPHTDYGCITILAQDATGGLHVRLRSGEWVAAPYIEDTFVVNIGDMMARWTNDRFVSTPHRVINTAPTDRYSIAFFFDPAMDTVVRCLETCVSAAAPARYAPIRYGDYLLGRLDAQYAYRKAGAADVTP